MPKPGVAESVTQRQRLMAVTAGAFPSLDTAVNVAFPAIADEFELAVADLQWIVISYLLVYGALLVGAGRVGDAVGYRRLVWWGSAISIVGLAGCAAAPTFATFLVARALQGIGTALVLAGAPALLTTAADGSKGAGRGRAVGLFQTATMVGLTIGPIVGAPLVEYLGWRAVYFSRIPIALALLVMAHGLRRVAKDDGPQLANSRIDLVELTLGVATVAGVVAVAGLGRIWGWFDVRLAALAATTAVVTIVFARRNRRSHSPMIDPSDWGRPGFLRANVLTAVANGAVFPIWLLVPTLLIDQAGIALIASGLVLAVSPALSSFSSSWVGRRVDNQDLRTIVTLGLALQACGMFMLGVVGPAGSIAPIVIGVAVVGAGLGIFSVPNMHQVMATLPLERQGVAGGLALTMRTVGIVIAVALASAIFDPIERSSGFGDAFRIVFVIAAALLIASAAVSRMRLSRPVGQDASNDYAMDPNATPSRRRRGSG